MLEIKRSNTALVPPPTMNEWFKLIRTLDVIDGFYATTAQFASGKT